MVIIHPFPHPQNANYFNNVQLSNCSSLFLQINKQAKETYASSKTDSALSPGNSNGAGQTMPGFLNFTVFM